MIFLQQPLDFDTMSCFILEPERGNADEQTITQVTKLCDVMLRMLRRYEKLGLITPFIMQFLYFGHNCTLFKLYR